MTIVEFKQKDYGVNLNFTVYTADGRNVMYLTGYDVYFNIWEKDGTTVFSTQCTVDDATNGAVHFSIPEGTFDTITPTHSGVEIYQDFYCEIELRKTGVKQSSETMIFRVLQSV